MKKVYVAIILIVAVMGCGTESPFDAQVVGPSDLTLDLYSGGGNVTWQFTGPLVFKVLNSGGTKPLPGIDIEFYADGELTDKLGNVVGTANATGSYLKTKTNDQGAAEVFARDTFPPCDATSDLTYTSSVQAVAKAVTATWTASVTIKQC
jgi:hypothetical protein